jgi:hypothetical protein
MFGGPGRVETLQIGRARPDHSHIKGRKNLTQFTGFRVLKSDPVRVRVLDK